MTVVDASIVANAVGDDGPDGASARAAIRGTDLDAPDLVDVEVLSVLRKRWLAGTLDDRRFDQAVADLLDLPIERHPTKRLITRAADLRGNLTPYDAVYVALAEVLGRPLITADRRRAGTVPAGTLQEMPRTLHLEAWAGRWIALDANDEVQIDAATLSELLEIIEREGPREVEVMRAPAPGEPIVYGLG